MQYLVYYSGLLADLRLEMNWKWNEFSVLSKIDPNRMKNLAESLHETLELREKIANFARNDELNDALSLCRVMITKFQDELKK